MKNKKKILFFLPSFAGGGAEKVALTIINNIPLDEYEVHLTVLNDYGKLKKMLNHKIILHNLKILRLRYAVIKIFKNISLIKPDIIFSTFININILLLFFKFFFKKTFFIIRAESVPSNHFQYLPYSFLYRVFYYIFYKRADCLIASCKIIYDEFIYSGAKSTNVEIIPNPVENIMLINNNKKIRHKGEGIRIVAAGRLSEQKGYDYLLKVVSKLKSNVHCTILGEGVLEDKLKKLSQELKIENQVKFEGYVDDPYPYLNGADALLITSNFEGLPNIALESLSLGTQVIATPNCGGLKELNNSKIYKKGKEFEQAVENIQINTDIKIKLLDNRFDIHNVMKKFLNVINSY